MVSTNINSNSNNHNRRVNHYHWKLSVIYFLILFCHQQCNSEQQQQQQQQDFQFDVSTDDDLQVVFTEAVAAADRNQSDVSPYEQEMSKCPYTENKLMLTLVLRSSSWDEIIRKKQERAIKKLSKFFGISKEFISMDNIHRRNIYEMTKYSIRQGLNQLDNNKKLGKVEFMIGCGNAYFSNGQSIANQIAQQMFDGSINDISGLDFGWWLIWSKRMNVNNRVPRNKRDATSTKEGSGEDDYSDDYYDDNEDDEGVITEIPIAQLDNNKHDEHPHRHHHGDESGSSSGSSSIASKVSTDRIADTVSTPKSFVSTTDSSEYDETVYDDYDDEEKNQPGGRSPTQNNVATTEKTLPPIAIDTFPTMNATTPTTTPLPPTPTTNPIIITTTEYVEPEPVNYPPNIRNRLPKQPVTAGRAFSFMVPLETFYDTEDGTNLKLALLDKSDHLLKPNSWIQFNPETREIYGLPLEDAVSKWQFKLRATDSGNESVVETLDISVQQHKAHRSANHEISIAIKLNEKFPSQIDWQIRLIRGIAETLGDNNLNSIVVREVRYNMQDVNTATLIYTNDTLPKDKCPEEKLDELFQRLTMKSLSDIVKPDITVKSVTGKPIGPCAKTEVIKPKLPKPTPHMTKNYPPVPRNQVDRVNATVGELLVFKVPADTFYDPEDNTDLKLSLLSTMRSPLDPKHWLQFDAKNQEFYGIPKHGDSGQTEYILVAEDREGLTAADALVVVVSRPSHREYSSLIEMTLGMSADDFNNSAIQRRFVERIAQIFGDATTANIQIRKISHTGKAIVGFYNTTLNRNSHSCPNYEIEYLKKVLAHQDGSIRHRVKDMLGTDFDVMNVNFVPMGACMVSEDTIHHAMIPIGKPDETPSSGFKDDYLLTFVLPAVIIIAMLLLASIIACVLHRRRMTGKMELGDEEERRSFRSKGIPVIFQDELDEKPEIGNKSPIILKDEKPPLLPPSYNSTNPDEHEDMDEYVPPPAVVMNGRESRGKSPVTPSYRKPPPYVSP